MIAKDLISSLIPPLKVSDSGDQALIWMNEFNVTHLPVIDKGKFIGLLSEAEIFDCNDLDIPIGKQKPELLKLFVNERSHIYEVIKVAAGSHLTVIPVVDEKENYIGVITSENIIRYFATLSAIKENGGIIVLELNKSDYSLSEIARIVESNNVSILSSYLSLHKDSTKLEVTLKVSSTEIQHIVATFERFSYKVTGSYQESEYFEDLKERFSSLMSYLNI